MIVGPYRIAHITEKSDVRMQVLRARPDLIFHALEAPEIIEATPPQKRDMPVPHYSQTFIVENAQTPQTYVGVAVSLANAPEQQESAEHFVLTVYCPLHRNLYYPDGSLKPRWMRVRQAHKKPALGTGSLR